MEGSRQGRMIAVGVSTVITGIILLFGNILMYAFTDTPELVELSMHMMRILAVGYIAVAVTQSLSGIMRGAGDTMSPMWLSLLTTVGIRVPLAYALVYFTKSETLVNGAPESMFISLLVSWCLGAVLNIFFFRKGNWKNKALA